MHIFTYTEVGSTCPLCKQPAACTLRDRKNQKHVRCDHCGEFVITCVAEQILSPYPATFREQYSAQAKRSYSERLFFIKRPLTGSNEMVHVEFLPRRK